MPASDNLIYEPPPLYEGIDIRGLYDIGIEHPEREIASLAREYALLKINGAFDANKGIKRPEDDAELAIIIECTYRAFVIDAVRNLVIRKVFQSRGELPKTFLTPATQKEIAAWYDGVSKRLPDRWWGFFPYDGVRDYFHWRKYHEDARHGLKERLDPELEAVFRKAVGQYVSMDRKVEPKVVMMPARKDAKTLSTAGVVRLEPLTKASARQIREHLMSQPAYPGAAPNGSERVDAREITEGHASWDIEVLLDHQPLIKIANDPHALAVVQEYLGATPIIIGYNAWYSCADALPPSDAQLFHRDADDFRFVKMFVYLTDVGPEDGPHVFVNGSHDTARLAKVRARMNKKWPKGDFDQWYFRTLRKREDMVAEVFGDQSIALTGPAGTRFVEDTTGMHLGMPPRKKGRLLFQVQYGLTPHIAENNLPVSRKGRAVDDYTNWFYS